MKKTNNEFMQNILDEEAWKDLSYDFEWTENLLEKYQDKVDWKMISSHNTIKWTVPMVQKFSNKIHWTEFSSCVCDFATVDTLEQFKEKWDWHELSGNRNVELSFEMLEKFADYWDWCEIINPYDRYPLLFKGKAMQFFEKFQEYIPVSQLFQDSALWREMVNEHKERIIGKIDEGEIEWIDLGLESGNLWGIKKRKGKVISDYRTSYPEDESLLPSYDDYKELMQCTMLLQIKYDQLEKVKVLGPNRQTYDLLLTDVNCHEQSDFSFWVKSLVDKEDKRDVCLLGFLGVDCDQSNGGYFKGNQSELPTGNSAIIRYCKEK